MKKTYRGSCHCGRVTFEAAVDLAEVGTSKCNCTFAGSGAGGRRGSRTRVKTDEFKALTGAEELSHYPRAAEGGPGGFCKHCGVTPFGWVDASGWNPTAYVSVNVACLNDLDPAELLAAPTQYCDGRANNWWNPPAETRHL